MSAGNQPDPIAPRLRPAQVGIRQDLEVHRHVFRGEVSYVFRDPMTLAVHKVSEADYQLCAALDEDRPLGEIFDQLVEEGRVEQEDEESFFQFILGLHGLGFLNLPVPDNESLYRRRQQKLKAKRSAKLMGFLFLQVPLINPDTFLERTKHLVSWVFTKWALMVWTVVVGSALVLLVKNRAEFFTPIGDVFTPERLMGMWFSLVVLKIIHEYGHAYACKVFGGEVPEIGAYFIAGTPCAYCDCTASWGFTKRAHRLIVVLAGVYVELFIAALAVFVWSIAPSATVKLIAFDIVVVAGVATVLANLNPLMRFDGYYIFSDLLEIPNLRATAQKQAINLLKFLAIGVPIPPNRYSFGLNTGLVIFGILSALYKITIVLGISALLSTKYLYLGIGLAAFYGAMEFYKAAKNIGNYLIHSEEAQHHRIRAGALASMVFAALPAVLIFVPVPRPIMATGMVGLEREQAYYAGTNGFVESVHVNPGDVISTGTPIATLDNPQAKEAVDAAQHQYDAARIRADSLLSEDPAQAAIYRETAESSRKRLDREVELFERLEVTADSSAVVIQTLPKSKEGSFVTLGEPIAKTGSGRWVIRGLVREALLADVGLRVGDTVEFRSASDPGATIPATITHIGQLGKKEITHETLTALGGGEIPISPVTGEANEPYFEIEAIIVGQPAVSFGNTGRIYLGTHSEPIATSLWRSGLRLMQKLEQQ
ncbi:MAG: efflux RND transporter periplasmic adaptor subunit [Phycisphaerales bacterium JB061]